MCWKRKKCQEKLTRLSVFVLFFFFFSAENLTSCAALHWSALLCAGQCRMSALGGFSLYCLYVGIFCSIFVQITVGYMSSVKSSVLLWFAWVEKNLPLNFAFLLKVRKNCYVIVFWEISCSIWIVHRITSKIASVCVGGIG